MEENKDSEFSTTIKLLCIVCRDYLKNIDIVYCSSICGHVFHKDCILRWLQNDSRCPQCCGNAREYLLHRLVLNFNEAPQLHEIEAEPIKSLEWRYLDKHITSDEMSQYGLKLGLDEKGSPMYAARYCFGDDLVPAYYIPKLEGLRVIWQNELHFIEKKIEILHITSDNADYEWVAATDGGLPEHAFWAGYSDYGDRMYFARSFYENMLRYGYFSPCRSDAIIPFEEKEVACNEYEVLVRIPRDKSEEEITFK